MFIENSAKHLETKIKVPLTVPECTYVFIGTHKYSFKKKTKHKDYTLNMVFCEYVRSLGNVLC